MSIKLATVGILLSKFKLILIDYVPDYLAGSGNAPESFYHIIRKNNFIWEKHISLQNTLLKLCA